MRFDSCAQEKATRWRDTGCSQLANFGGIARHDREPGRHACVCGHNTVVLPRHRDAGPEEITNRGRSKMSITWIQVGSSHSTKGYTHPPLLSYGLHVAAWRPEPGAAESCILRPARLKRLTLCIYNLLVRTSGAGAPLEEARTRLPAGFKPPQGVRPRLHASPLCRVSITEVHVYCISPGRRRATLKIKNVWSKIISSGEAPAIMSAAYIRETQLT